MSGNVYKMRAPRGFGLQCPWSNCFPQLYAGSRAPCALTPFADYRELTDHIWKYHSSRLSCHKCNHRFSGARRTESNTRELEALKDTHAKKCQSDKNSNHSIMTMTDVQDKSLKSWRPQNSKDEDSVKANYDSLCRSLFGNDIKLPENPKYHYLIPEYTTNPVSSLLGQQNIDYVRQRQPIADLSTTSDSQQQPHLMTHHSAQQFNFTQYTTYPLSLDAPHPYANLEVMKPPPDQDQDSGYVSQGRRELAPPPPDTSGYIDPRDIQNPTAWQHVGHSIAMAGAFSQGTIEMPAPFEMDYELENPEDPSS